MWHVPRCVCRDQTLADSCALLLAFAHSPAHEPRKTNRLRALAVAGVQVAAGRWRRGSASCELLGSWLSRLEFLYMSETSRSTIRLLSVTACADSPAVHHRSLTKSVRYLSTQGHCTASKYAHLHCHTARTHCRLSNRLDCDAMAETHSATSHYDRQSFVGLAWRPQGESMCCGTLILHFEPQH